MAPGYAEPRHGVVAFQPVSVLEWRRGMLNHGMAQIFVYFDSIGMRKIFDTLAPMF